MTCDMEIYGKLLAFEQIVEAEMDEIGRCLDEFAKLYRDNPEGRDDALSDEAIIRVRFIAKQCANVLGILPSPAPLAAKGEV